MRKKAILWLSCSLFSLNIHAQCPSVINASVSGTTPANCPSNGGFVIGGTSSPEINYQILSGPLGYPVSPQSSGTFNSLLAGNYSVRAYCNANPSIADTVSVTVADNYVQVAATSATSNICTNGTPGGLITTTVTAGNRTPFTYAYWQGNPNADNSALTFGTSATYMAPAFGTYNVRVKDACGVYVTQQVTVTRTYPAPMYIVSAYPRNGSLTCAELQDSIMVVLYTNVDFSVLPAPGASIDVYLDAGSCTAGALVKTVPVTPSFDRLVKIPNHQNLVFKMRTPCGDTTTFCYAYNAAYQAFSINTSGLEQLGCPLPGNPVPMALYSGPDNSEMASAPITYHVTNAGGTIDTTIVAANPNYIYLPGLSADTYTVIATDACGRTDTAVVIPPAGSGAPLAATNVSAYKGCTSITGRTTLQLTLTGNMPNLINAVCTIIPPSPANVGEAGLRVGGTTFIWANAIPGATYTIKVDNNSATCSNIDTITVTVPNDPGSQISQSVATTVQQLCGGTGNVTVAITYTGNGSVTYQLLNSANDTVGSGTQPGGTFANLPAGTYRTMATVAGGCGPYALPTDTAIILAGGSGPSIIKKLGVICEDAGGNPTATGKALVSFIGVAPLSVDYRLTSAPDVPASYTSVSANSGGTETITGLLANTSYTIRVADGCGNSIPTQVSIGQMAPLHVNNTVNPCVGSAYTLSVPDLVDATYSWKKDNVTLTSNTHEINFPSYAAGDNGVYECTIVVAGCVTRVVSTMLNSQICGQPLPVALLSFEVTDKGNQSLLSWRTAIENYNKGFSIERTTEGAAWSTIGFLASKAQGGNSARPLDYTFYDKTPRSGMNYYRLRQTDADGQVTVSEIRGLYFGRQSNIRLAPNPAVDQVQVWGVPAGATLRLIDVSGRVVAEQQVTPSVSTISMTKLPAAIYLVQVITGGVVTESVKLVKK